MLRKTVIDELAYLQKMETQPHARGFINATSLTVHRTQHADPTIIYLSIIDNTELVGYFILALEANNTDVEFRRIVIDANQRGIGQRAILLMEAYCRDTLQQQRIWLDVYEDNSRGIHIYEKLGYRYDHSIRVDDRTLRFYSKDI